jgi:toxin ParE1/3/4
MAARQKLKIVYTEQSKSDLRSIGEYTQKHWGSEQRRLYLKQLAKKVELLAVAPSIGTEIGGGDKPCRMLVVGRHGIISRRVNDRLEIIRVLHCRRDIELALELEATRNRKKTREIER